MHENSIALHKSQTSFVAFNHIYCTSFCKDARRDVQDTRQDFRMKKDERDGGWGDFFQ